MLGLFDFSPTGRARVVLWTVMGTLGIIAVTIFLDSLGFGRLNTAERWRSLFMDVLVPIVIGVPAICVFSNKLRELAIAQKRLEVHASTDSLTALLNRGAFTARVEASLTHVDEQARGGALLVIDVDHFKRVNDCHGHDMGDEALRLVAEAIKRVVRSVDVVGRMGGEEFCVYLPGCSSIRAELVAERIRRTIEDLEFLPDGVRRNLSVSVGGATFDQQLAFADLYRVADRRLYVAKEGGRNCVSLTGIKPVAAGKDAA